MKNIPEDYQIEKYYGKPIWFKDGGEIRFKDSVIVFLPIKKEIRGMEIEICFVPDHMKGIPWVDVMVWPMMHSPLLGYYNQKDIAH